MKMLSVMILSLVCATSAFGQEGPGRGEVTIKDVVANGSGCPVGSASAIVTNSKEGGPIDMGEVTFDEFIVENPGKARKFCNLAIDMKFPRGWSYTVDTISLPGTAVIQEGVNGTVTFDVAFRGSDAEAKSKRSQSGYWEGEFKLYEEFDAPVWSPCGKVLPVNVKITVALSGKPESEGAPSVIHVAGNGGKQYFGIRWRRC